MDGGEILGLVQFMLFSTARQLQNQIKIKLLFASRDSRSFK